MVVLELALVVPSAAVVVVPKVGGLRCGGAAAAAHRGPRCFGLEEADTAELAEAALSHTMK